MYTYQGRRSGVRARPDNRFGLVYSLRLFEFGATANGGQEVPTAAAAAKLAFPPLLAFFLFCTS